MDSLLSIVQMPGGVPVATLAIGTAGAKNAALLAVSILANKQAAPAPETEGLSGNGRNARFSKTASREVRSSRPRPLASSAAAS